MYHAGAQNVAQEMEKNRSTAELMALPGSTLLRHSFSPFPARDPALQHGTHLLPEADKLHSANMTQGYKVFSDMRRSNNILL